MAKLKFTYETKLDNITPERIQMYLDDYQEQVHQLDELAADWNILDEEERSQYQWEFDIALGRRHILKLLYKAKKLTPSFEIQFAKIEQELFDKAHIAWRLFGYDEEILDFDDVSYLYHRPSIKVRIEAAHQEHLEDKGEAIDDVIQELDHEL